MDMLVANAPVTVDLTKGFPDNANQAEERRLLVGNNGIAGSAEITVNGTAVDYSNGTTIGHVHLHVGDLDQGAAFYHDALGFDKVVWGYPGALFLSAGGYHHHLGTNTWAAGAPPATDDDARLIEWELILPDRASVADASTSIEKSGGTVERSDDGSTLARDPWGTVIRLVSAG